MAILPTNQLQPGQQNTTQMRPYTGPQQSTATGGGGVLPAGWQAMGNGMMYNPNIQFPAGVTSGAQIQRDYLPNYVNIKPLPGYNDFVKANEAGWYGHYNLPWSYIHAMSQKQLPTGAYRGVPGGQPMNTTQPVPGYPIHLPNTQLPTNNGGY